MDGGAVATLPQLAEALAPHDGRSVSTLRVVAQTLRNAGFISVGRAGRGALHMGPEDCAALVLAGLWTDAPCASARAVEVLSGLKRLPAPPAPNIPRSLFLVTEMPTFGETVSSLIEYGRLIRKQVGGACIELSVDRLLPNAALALVDPLGRRCIVARWCVNANKLMAGHHRPETRTAVDRRHTTTITGTTLFALSDLIPRESVREAA